jgi:hypothetical protein
VAQRDFVSDLGLEATETDWTGFCDPIRPGPDPSPTRRAPPREAARADRIGRATLTYRRVGENEQTPETVLD